MIKTIDTEYFDEKILRVMCKALDVTGSTSLWCPMALSAALELMPEVDNYRKQEAEAVPLGYALANLDGTIRNHGDGELMVYRNPFSRSDKTDCIPLYMHPPSLDDDTRKMVLELCSMFEQFGYMPSQGAELIGKIREKLGAGDE